jgi:two-component system phosphate regulon response regulator PhoB
MKKILIVDDQPEIRELVAVTLRIGTYHLLQAKSGMEALDVARREKPDLILLDVMLLQGEMDGFEVCRRLKADTETSQCCVMILTARSQEWDKKQGLAAGAHDYFVKPFSPLELLTKVSTILTS